MSVEVPCTSVTMSILRLLGLWITKMPRRVTAAAHLKHQSVAAKDAEGTPAAPRRADGYEHGYCWARSFASERA